MKKYLSGLFLLLAGTLSFTSCNSDDSDSTSQTTYTSFSDGAYIVNAGNMYSNIESTLTHIDYSTNNATTGVFKAANGRSLGNTANDGLVYGEKIYLCVDQSNTIEVLDRKTLKSIKTLSTTELLGEKDGSEPRHIISGAGQVFFTTYGGYVAAVDTATFALKNKYQVGNYPEGLAGIGDYIVVANSNYGQGGGNISVINLKTSQVQTLDIQDVNNPTKVFTVTDGSIYVLDGQYYDASYNTYGENALRRVDISAKTSTKVADCNYACLASVQNVLKFYTINAPYGATTVDYKVINLTSGTGSTSMGIADADAVFSPCGIEVDPVSGHIFVLSYNKGDGGYADYNGNGYVAEYDANGKKLRQYTTGVGSCAIFFDCGVKVSTTK